MNYLGPLGRVFGGLKGLYSGINGATLTGAIDVVIVEQEDGTYKCSPFHVRFGKLGVLRSREKVVDIEINGHPSTIRMKLGESGEAFFVQELDHEDLDEFDDYLITSPLPGSSPVEFDSHEVEESIRRGLEEEKRKQELGSPILEEASAAAGPSASSMAISAGEDSKSSTKKRRRRKKRGQNGSKSDIVINTSSIPEQSQLAAANPDEQIFDMDMDDEDYLKTKLNELAINPQAAPSTPGATAAPTTLTHSRSFIREFHSDTEADARTPSRPSTPIQSDSEYEISKVVTGVVVEDANVNKWVWGELPVSSAATTPTAPGGPAGAPAPIDSSQLKSKAPSDEELRQHRTRSDSQNRSSMLAGMFSFMKKKDEETGIYLDDLNLETMDREQVGLYFPNYREETSPRRSGGAPDSNNTSPPPPPPLPAPTPATAIGPHLQAPHPDSDLESGKGSSLPTSPQPGSSPVQSGGEWLSQLQADTSSPMNFEAISLCGSNLSLFDQSTITYDELAENPDLILQAPPDSIVVKVNGKLVPWPAILPQLMSNTVFGRSLPGEVQRRLAEQYMKKELSPSTANGGPSTSPGAVQPSSSSNRKSFWFPWRRSGTSTSASELELLDTSLHGLKGSSSSSDESEVPHQPQRSRPPHHTIINISSTPLEKYRKSLRLTSAQITQLALVPGQNEAVFSVTTAYQGTTVARCHIYLWKWNDRVVISDIDGTITKSDVLGHVLPMIGTDWAQSGVAQLFTQIEANGYKLLYLSARAIGQASTTRDYLRSIRQDNLTLPAGPLLLNPTSLMSALHREVIERKPEEFKIACLNDVRLLFPTNPFYAGYGNKINDVWAYRSVGVPVPRIFTINHRGELRHALTNTFQSSYTSLVELAEHIFPPYKLKSFNGGMDGYGGFEFWREPLRAVSGVKLPKDVEKGSSEDKTQKESTATGGAAGAGMGVPTSVAVDIVK